MITSPRSKPIPTKKSNPCPVCGDQSGKCRTHSDSPIVLCMTLTSSLDTAPGYHYIKPTKNRSWAIWAPDDDAKFDRHAWKQRTEVTRQIKQVELANVMSLDERDRFYCDWLAKGSLNERDRADLRRRGLTDAEIDELPARSMEIGYAVPFPGLSGKFVGAQWRLANPIDEQRYRWHNLPNGKEFPGTDELPIAVYRSENPSAIALVEGTGIKPMLTAQRFGMIAVGAAGGLHASSPIQLKAVLKTFPSLPICVAVDAGDLINPHVMRRHRRTAETLRELGIEVKFIWWNQTTKEECDIDEIDAETFEAAQLLTIEQIEALVPNDSAKGFETIPEKSKQSDRDYQIQKRHCQFNQYWDGGLKRDFQLSPVIPGVTAQVEYEGYCPTLDLTIAPTIAVQGWLGAGKTESMLSSLVPIKSDFAIVWSAPLNGLNRNTADRAGGEDSVFKFETYRYQDDVSLHRRMLECDQPGLYFACPDSFKPYTVRHIDWSTKILVIDEFSGIRKALINKPEQELFFDAIAKCKQLIIADAFLSDADIALIRKHRSGNVALYRQKFKKSPTKIKWFECRTKEGEISFSHDGVYFDLLQSWVDSGFERIAIAVDAIVYAKAIKQFLEGCTFADGRKPRVWLACSKTVEENQDFMLKPDKTIEDNQIDVVIYSPTAKSGLDIKSSFDRGLLICCGVLPPTEMLQMLGRCRKCLEWFVSAPRRSSNPGTIAPSLDGKLVRQWAEQISRTFEEFGFNAPSHLQGWGLWEARTKDIEKAFGSEYVYALLLKYFESVETIEVSSNSVVQWRNTISQIKRQDAEKTLNANLERGMQLIRDQKQPANNAQVWDLKLAQLSVKYPKLIANLRDEAVAGGAGSQMYDDAIEFVRTLTSRRVEKLKNWVQAVEGDPQDDRDLLNYLRDRRMNYNSGAFKALQNLALFRSLNLARLAKWTGGKLKSEHINEFCFNVRSPVIVELWQQFQATAALHKLFPFVATIADFWQAIRSCLGSLGYQSESTKQRTQTDEAHANGNFRGKQRYVKSKTEHFIAWLLMECSGSAFFRGNFELIIEAIRDRLAAERLERQHWRDSHTAPPPTVEAA